MSTAIIGLGNIGTAVAAHLTTGGEAVILAANTPGRAQQLAGDLGPSASAAETADAIERADTVVFAVWFDVLRDLVGQNADPLAGKVVVDPSNPIGPDGKGGFKRTLPDGVSSGFCDRGHAHRRRALRQGVRNCQRGASGQRGQPVA